MNYDYACKFVNCVCHTKKRLHTYIPCVYNIIIHVNTYKIRSYEKKHLRHRLSNKRQLATARPVVNDRFLPRAHLK